jgi:hypothetical protein
MKPMNIVVLGVLAAMLIVVIAQLRAPERVEVSALEEPLATDEPQPRTPVGRFDAAVSSLGSDSFQRQLVLSELTGHWRNLGMPPDLPQAVADGRLGSVSVQLDNAAANGNHQANFVLAELGTFCEEVRAARGRDEEPLIRAAQNLKPEDTAHIRDTAGWMSWLDEQLYLQCRDAVIDSIAVATRIDAAANEGHAPSLWRRGLMETDPARSYRDVLDSALSGYPAAQITLANYFAPQPLPLFAGQKVRGSRSLWLQEAASHSASGQAMLGECYRQGCDGAAPAPARAVEFLIPAARAGLRIAHRGLSELAESNPDVLPKTQAYAWRVLSQRLNELGCYGLNYGRYYIEDARELPVLRARLGDTGQKTADTFANQWWAQYEASARGNLGCAAG